MHDHGHSGAMLSALDLARRVEAGELTPRDLVELCAEAIAVRENDVGAFVALDLDAARHAAAAPGLAALPLSGLPVAFKDIFDTADLPTQYGSPIYAGYRPRADATAVVMTRQAGGVIIGKTVTTQFASLVPSPTRNPHHLAHTPGGSSAGSAAAVAAGFVPIAFGTQTAGSVIRPAAFCGVAALQAVLSADPVGRRENRVLASRHDRSVRRRRRRCRFRRRRGADARFARRSRRAGGATHRARPHASVAAGECGDGERGRDRRARCRGGRCARQRARRCRRSWNTLIAAQHVIQDYETLRALAFEYDRHRDQIDPLLRDQLAAAEKISADDYDAARRTSSRARQMLADAMADHDVILTPSAPGAAPAGLGATGNPMFNRLWTLMGAPCVNVPGLSENGLPLGVQIVGRFGRDKAALEAALFLEQAIKRKMGA